MVTKEQLEKLTTSRLLAYLKSQRRGLFKFSDEWGFDPDKKYPEEQKLQTQYDLTKEVLATRENIR